MKTAYQLGKEALENPLSTEIHYPPTTKVTAERMTPSETYKEQLKEKFHPGRSSRERAQSMGEAEDVIHNVGEAAERLKLFSAATRSMQNSFHGVGAGLGTMLGYSVAPRMAALGYGKNFFDSAPKKVDDQSSGLGLLTSMPTALLTYYLLKHKAPAMGPVAALATGGAAATAAGAGVGYLTGRNARLDKESSAVAADGGTIESDTITKLLQEKLDAAKLHAAGAANYNHYLRATPGMIGTSLGLELNPYMAAAGYGSTELPDKAEHMSNLLSTGAMMASGLGAYLALKHKLPHLNLLHQAAIGAGAPLAAGMGTAYAVGRHYRKDD